MVPERAPSALSDETSLDDLFAAIVGRTEPDADARDLSGEVDAQVDAIRTAVGLPKPTLPAPASVVVREPLPFVSKPSSRVTDGPAATTHAPASSLSAALEGHRWQAVAIVAGAVLLGALVWAGGRNTSGTQAVPMEQPVASSTPAAVPAPADPPAASAAAVPNPSIAAAPALPDRPGTDTSTSGTQNEQRRPGATPQRPAPQERVGRDTRTSNRGNSAAQPSVRAGSPSGATPAVAPTPAVLTARRDPADEAITRTPDRTPTQVTSPTTGVLPVATTADTPGVAPAAPTTPPDPLPSVQTTPPPATSPVATPVAAVPRGPSREPVLLKRVVPTYPKLAAEFRHTGDVDLDVQIDATGRVTDAVVVAGPGTLRDAARTAVMQWQYQPAQVGGVPAAVRRRVRVSFNSR